MKIKFTKLPTTDGTIKVSLDGGNSFKDYKIKVCPCMCLLFTYQSTFSLHMLRVFLNASLKNSGDALFKSRSVPACACCLHTNERFSLHMLRVFLNALLKNSGKLCLKGGLSLHVLNACIPEYI